MNMVRTRFLRVVLLATAAAYPQAPEPKADRYALGVAQVSAGNYEKAKTYLEQAVKVDPKNAKAWLSLGIVRGKLGDGEGRYAAYRRAIEIDPGYAEAHYNLGFAYLLDGDRCAANAEADKLAGLDVELSRKLDVMIAVIIFDPFGSGCGVGRSIVI
jgi:Flp pilus assembly protein TadD